MALFASLSSTGTLAIGGALVASVVVGVVIVRQNSDVSPVVGGVPAQLSAPSIPATPVRKTALITNQTAPSSPSVKRSASTSANTATNIASGTATGLNTSTPSSAATSKVTTSATVLSSVSPRAATASDALGLAPLTDPQSLALGVAGDTPVASQHSGGRLVARLDPEPQINVSTAPLGKPKLGKTATTPVVKSKLRFDVVRVDKVGSAVVAGKAIPGQIVAIMVNGAEIAQAKADNRGGFVALFDLPNSQTPQVITLTSKGNNGITTRSSDRVLVMGRAVVEPLATSDSSSTTTNAKSAIAASVESSNAGDTLVQTVRPEAAPAVIIATDEGVKVVQPIRMAQTTPELSANVTIDLISYDSKGEVVLTGRSKPGQHVRVYVDGRPIKTEAVASDGTWQLSLPEVDAGRYTLRVDEIDAAGQVTSRIETPFQKEFADSVKRVASNGDLGDGTGSTGLPFVQKVTIQPGATLWALAEANYGQGDLYMQIFNANRDFIRDPDLIYPGQIFTIPN